MDGGKWINDSEILTWFFKNLILQQSLRRIRGCRSTAPAKP
jgi:hypothetical protein